MKFTFGVITDYANKPRLIEVVQSIKNLDIPDCEILLSQPNGWITHKKNEIARRAIHENLVLLHDYYVFDANWYKSYVALQGYAGWDICSNPQYMMNGKRHFTDWVNWDHPDFPRYFSFNYEDWTHTKNQYISGGYFLVKRDLLRANPFNEVMVQGDPEDVEWSLRVRDKARILCNPNAIVRHIKEHRDCY